MLVFIFKIILSMQIEFQNEIFNHLQIKMFDFWDFIINMKNTNSSQIYEILISLIKQIDWLIKYIYIFIFILNHTS